MEPNLLITCEPEGTPLGASRPRPKHSEPKRFLAPEDLISSGRSHRVIIQEIRPPRLEKHAQLVLENFTAILALSPAAQMEWKREFKEEERIFDFFSAVAASPGDSQQELNWLRENGPHYAGQWIALDGDRLLAFGTDARDVYNRARLSGVNKPLIVKVPGAREELPFGGW